VFDACALDFRVGDSDRPAVRSSDSLQAAGQLDVEPFDDRLVRGPPFTLPV